MNVFVVSDMVGEWPLPDSLKKDRLCEIVDTGLLRASMESIRDNRSVELVLELERDAVCLDTEFGNE